jgi:hypothetical protein
VGVLGAEQTREQRRRRTIDRRIGVRVTREAVFVDCTCSSSTNTGGMTKPTSKKRYRSSKARCTLWKWRPMRALAMASTVLRRKASGGMMSMSSFSPPK